MSMPQPAANASGDIELGAARRRSKYHYQDLGHRPRITSNPDLGSCLEEDDADDLQKDLFKERLNPATGVGGSFSVSIHSNNTFEDPTIQQHELGGGPAQSWRRRKIGAESGACPAAPSFSAWPTWNNSEGYPAGATSPVAEPPPISLEENFVVAGAGSILKRRQRDGRLPDNALIGGDGGGGGAYP